MSLTVAVVLLFTLDPPGQDIPPTTGDATDDLIVRSPLLQISYPTNKGDIVIFIVTDFLVRLVINLNLI